MKNRIADNWDRVLSSSPLNKTAAAVTGGSEDNHELKVKIVCAHSSTPFRTTRPPWNCPDLKGRKYGRLTVIGYHDSKDSARWVVRCACGDYELRRSKSVLKAHPDERCHKCRALQHRINHQKFLTTARGQVWSKANCKPLIPGETSTHMQSSSNSGGSHEVAHSVVTLSSRGAACPLLPDRQRVI